MDSFSLVALAGLPIPTQSSQQIQQSSSEEVHDDEEDEFVQELPLERPLASALDKEDRAALAEIESFLNKKKQTSSVQVPARLRQPLGRAHLLYATGDFLQAKALLEDVIKQAPACHAPWATLSLVHAAAGDSGRALAAGIVAAHLRPSDAETWRGLARSSLDLHLLDQAIYCINKAVKRNKNDTSLKYMRSKILAASGRTELAIAQLRALIDAAPDSPCVAADLSQLYSSIGLHVHAARTIEHLLDADEIHPLAQIHFNPPIDPISLEPIPATKDPLGRQLAPTRTSFDLINNLSNNYIVMGDHEKAIVAIKQSIARMYRIPAFAVDLDSDNEFFPDISNGILDSDSNLVDPSSFLEDAFENHDLDSNMHPLRLSDVASSLSTQTNHQTSISRNKNIDPFTTRFIPPFLRTKLAICRLHLGDTVTANRHLSILYSIPINESFPFILDIAEAYMNSRKFHAALDVLKMIDGSDAVNAVDVWCKMARCFHGLGQDDMCLEYYIRALEKNPADKNIWNAFDNVVRDVNVDQISEAVLKRRDLLLSQRVTEVREKETQLATQSLIVLQDEARHREHRIAVDRSLTLSTHQSRSAENAELYSVFMRCCARHLSNQSEMGQRDDGRDWMDDGIRAARKLVTRIQGCKSFFYVGGMIRRIKKCRRLMHEIQGTTYTEPREVDDDDDANDGVDADKNGKEGRDVDVIVSDAVVDGLTLREWRDLLIRYALIAVVNGNNDDACAAMTTLTDSVLDMMIISNSKLSVDSKSYWDAFLNCESEKELVSLHDHTQLVLFVVLVYTKQYVQAVTVLRSFIHRYTCKGGWTRLYMLLVSWTVKNGSAASTMTGSNTLTNALDWLTAINHKFFKRQLTFVKEMYTKSVSSSTRSKQVSQKDALVQVYMMLGHLTMCSSSYKTAIVSYYGEAYRLDPENELLNLCMGVCHFGRSMQRQCVGRHWHVVTGITFMLKYEELRCGSCFGDRDVLMRRLESFYNIGRALHMVGLVNDAVAYYRKVLDLPQTVSFDMSSENGSGNDVGGKGDFDMTKMDCDAYWIRCIKTLRICTAYNLGCVYMMSGSPGLAQKVLSEYCWIDK